MGLMNKIIGNVKYQPFFEDGFWWWYDTTRKGWYTGPSPEISRPSFPTE
jgi:hypothetical protein